MASIPKQIPEELHHAWAMWFDHYRQSGSSPRRAQEEATASVRAHYLEPMQSTALGAPRAPRRTTGSGPYHPSRWQALCPHCGAVAHGDLACDQALRRLR
jgi:hypothetical protein